ncbi:hypothetical protein PCANC_15397 [Puccinia coronata f. sp. avenae]|uniref:Uncharacterized protein n=1 Tax=Puccinia coronata f. sp. avenae TaxID=200324 RepID=A0A2N5SU72_9BASI|nr:hypothetical protein PCANC_15397 [Puccinia coronata f. sp. avenae]
MLLSLPSMLASLMGLFIISIELSATSSLLVSIVSLLPKVTKPPPTSDSTGKLDPESLAVSMVSVLPKVTKSLLSSPLTSDSAGKSDPESLAVLMMSVLPKVTESLSSLDSV